MGALSITINFPFALKSYGNIFVPVLKSNEKINTSNSTQ